MNSSLCNKTGNLLIRWLSQASEADRALLISMLGSESDDTAGDLMQEHLDAANPHPQYVLVKSLGPIIQAVNNTLLEIQQIQLAVQPLLDLFANTDALSFLVTDDTGAPLWQPVVNCNDDNILGEP